MSAMVRARFEAATDPEPKCAQVGPPATAARTFFGIGGAIDRREGMGPEGDSLGCCCNDLVSDRRAPSRDSMEADHHV